MRGQGAIEYITIFAAVLVVFASITVPKMMDPGRDAAEESEAVSQVRSTADTIANAVNTIYANSGGTTTEVIELSRNWDLEMSQENLRAGAWIEGEKRWAEASLEYGFDDSLSNIPSGSRTVIVEWSQTENERIVLSEEKVYIYIRPGSV